MTDLGMTEQPEPPENPLTYSAAALAVLADFNHVDVAYMAKFWPRASNVYMHDWLELLGRRRAAGLPIYSEPGRLIAPSQLAESR